MGDTIFLNARMTAAAFERVDEGISCVVTRFRLKSILALPLAFFIYRKVRRQACREVPGLIKAAFLVEGPRTWYSLSIWADERSLIDFGTRASEHVQAARWCFEHLLFDRDRMRPEIWSTQWRLSGISHNQSWTGVDLRESIAKRQAVDSKKRAL